MNQEQIVHIWDHLLQDLFAGSVVFESDQALAKEYQSLNGSPETLTIFNASQFDMARAGYISSQVDNTLTQYARSNGQENHSMPATGRVAHYAVCVQVSWPWIDLSAGIAVLVLLFFGLTLQNNWTTRTPVWKSSPLPVFFHERAGAAWLAYHETNEALKQSLDLYKTKDMERVADMTTIRLMADREKPESLQLFQTGHNSLEPETALRLRVYKAMIPHLKNMSRDSLNVDE
ncbi:hypothetical protein F5Y19DRAFT_478595 [Xylariaceae sp. FL1651]|nr:hypothetical protein F5Y19DRAFT_478595 [Xylariaceae sp. FL1651]